MKEIIGVSWRKLTTKERVDLIADAIEFRSVADGFLMLRYMLQNGSIYGYITKKLYNNLCEEVVSQDTLEGLFGSDYYYVEEDAEVILEYIESINK